MKHLTFDVGTNFDKNLINVIAENNKNNQFSSVFGKLKTDFLGGGRSSAFLPDITMEELRDYIELCHKNKLEFNYLINAMCMENKELEADSHFKIIELLKELDKIGVDAITITSPYLCELIKTQFPRFKVTVGLYAYAFDSNQCSERRRESYKRYNLHLAEVFRIEYCISDESFLKLKKYQEKY